MASRKRKTIGFRTEEELADVVNEIVNGSDSDKDNIPEFSSSEGSESESANESNISIPDPSRRQIDVTPTTGFSINDRQPRKQDKFVCTKTDRENAAPSYKTRT